MRAILPVALAVFLFSGILRADDPILPGSTVKIEDATKQAEAVFIGKVTDLGPTVPTSPGMAAFNRAEIEVQKILRGSVDVKIMAEIDIFAVNREAMPTVGTPYLFFVQKGGDRFTVLKMLLPSIENIGPYTKH